MQRVVILMFILSALFPGTMNMDIHDDHSQDEFFAQKTQKKFPGNGMSKIYNQHIECLNHKQIQKIQRDGIDVYVKSLNLSGPNKPLGIYGVAEVGSETLVSTSIGNNGNKNANGTLVKCRVVDKFGNLIAEFEKEGIDIGNNSTVDVFLGKFIPIYSTQFIVNVTVSHPQDTYHENDRKIFPGYYVMKTINLCEDAIGWSGDISSNEWHITSSIQDDPNPNSHSSPYAWYCGVEGVEDKYEDKMHSELITPEVDLTRMDSTYFIYFNFLYYGNSSPDRDILSIYITDDDGLTWESLFCEISGAVAADAWYFRVSHWIDYDNDGVVDPEEPYDYGIDITKYAGRKVKFKFLFTSDETENNLGFYIDDITVSGMEHIKDVSIERIDVDGVPHVNETFQFKVTLSNIGYMDVESFNLNVSLPDGTLRNITIPSMKNGTKRLVYIEWSTDRNIEGKFRCEIEIDDDSPGNNYLWRAIRVTMGADILVVDDDGGPGNNGMLKFYNTCDVEYGITNSLTNLGYEYDIYLVANDESGPSSDILNRYSLVIWLTGYDNSYISREGTLNENDVRNIENYLMIGKKFWLISFECMWDLWDVRAITYFPLEKLHVISYVDDAGTPDPLMGVPDDVIGDGLSLDTAKPQGFYDKGDIIVGDNKTHGVFYQYNQAQNPITGPFNALRYQEDYKLLFFSFEFTFIHDEADRDKVVDRVMNWFWDDLEISMGPKEDIPPGENKTFEITLKSKVSWGIDVESVEIVYATTGWSASVSPISFTIYAYSTTKIYLNVKAPKDALFGDEGDITIAFHIEDYPSVLLKSVTFTVAVRYNLSIDGPEKLYGACGEKIDEHILIRNLGNVKMHINLSVGGEISNWCSISRKYVHLLPKKDAPIRITLDIPIDALSGTYYCVITASSDNISVKHKITLQINASRGLLIEGIILENGGLMDPYEKNELEVRVKITNLGNVNEDVFVKINGDSSLWYPSERTVSLSPHQKGKDVRMNIIAHDDIPSGKYELSIVAKTEDDMISSERMYFNVTIFRPDLYIDAEEILFEDAMPTVGTPTKITVLVRNKGNGICKGVMLTVYYNDVMQSEVYVYDEIPPMGAAYASFYWNVSSYGPQKLMVKIDEKNEIVEMNDYNNDVVLTIIGYIPDIQVENLKIEGGDEFFEGDVARIYAVISNKGKYCSDVQSFHVEILVDDVPIYVTNMQLSSNDSLPIFYDWKCKKGKHRIKVIADSYEEVSEMNEENNIIEINLNVKGREISQELPILLYIGIFALLSVISFAGVLALRKPPKKYEKVVVRRAKTNKIMCILCKKKVKKGGLYYRCYCGTRYHKRCAEKLKKCIICKRYVEI